MRRLSWLVIVALAVPHAAFADEPVRPEDGGADYFPAPTGPDIVLVIPGERTQTNIAVVAGLAGGGLVASGLGVYFNLQSKDAADAVSTHEAIGQIWTRADQAQVDRAHDNAVRAGIAYGLGGALLIASAVMYIVTEPRSERRIIHPHGTGKVTPTLAPTSGGALFGGTWSF